MTSLDSLLGMTSHTFSLAIRLLPDPLRREITIAYLLFRVADTLEDSDLWTPEVRVLALTDFGRVLRATGSPWRSPEPVRFPHGSPTGHIGCKKLLEELPQLLAALRDTSPDARAAIIERVGATVDGMIWYQLRSGRPGPIEIRDLVDLRGYSYVVAGLVGELLTDLFTLRCQVPPEAMPELRLRGLALGEGFQIVNILKDVPEDASSGRQFLPPDIDTREVVAVARDGLASSEPYARVLKSARAPKGVLAFLWFTVKLARRSLDRVEEAGLGQKMTPVEVRSHLATAQRFCEI